tara:strand:- start:945 stop:1259 length:315 start_codon:yes stop_codon:yes gene_type:complete
MQNTKLLKTLLILTLLFNLIDIIVSINIIHYGEIEEGNPVMKLFLNLGVIPFILAKVTLVGGGCIILWCHRETILARAGIYIVFSYYLFLMVYFYYMWTYPVPF